MAKIAGRGAGGVPVASAAMATELSKGRELDAPRQRTARLFERDPDVSPWLFWPTRVVAIAVLVPVMLVWELIVLVNRGVRRYLLEPLGVALHYVLVVPVRALGRALVWAGRWLLAGLRWLARYLLVLPAR